MVNQQNLNTMDILSKKYDDDHYIIPTLEGDMLLGKDDMLITGVDGEIYLCKKEIFEKTYEKA